MGQRDLRISGEHSRHVSLTEHAVQLCRIAVGVTASLLLALQHETILKHFQVTELATASTSSLGNEKQSF